MGLVGDVQSYLAAQGIVDGGTSWPSVRGLLHDGSERLVAVRGDGGANEIGASSGLGSAAFRDMRIHVTVRAAPHRRDDAEGKAQEIHEAMHGLMDTVMGATRYERVVADAPPVEVGQDERSRPLFTLSIRLAVPQGAPV